MEARKVSVWRWTILGIGLSLGAVFVFVIGAAIVFLSGPVGGVRVTSNMEDYALDYIEANNLLEPGEKIIVYYDATFRLNGTEAAILTDSRMIYHKQNTTSVIPLSEIERIDHEEHSLIGDIIRIFSKSGDIMVVEIAAVDDGKLFLDALEGRMSQLSQSQSQSSIELTNSAPVVAIEE